ncbi:uncharacterized protein LOC105702499 isoform X1 [Orussus abietinus]|uniref:uncharacterized protein LOC105702499 isoform X1 n=1 Tax=Orussus abietinus TaxID=222816 RepID=UPI000626A27E|nr:uncharacterized protein LOC105702499 isoform X1 [Orussus abietinus]
MGRRCVVPNCGAKSEKSPGNPRSATSSFFEEVKKMSLNLRFPKNTKMRDDWLSVINIKNDENFKLNAASCICSQHFIKDCFMAKQFGRATLLKKRAVPQLNIFRPEVEKYNPMHVPPSFLKEESHNTTEEVSQ